MSTPSRKHLTLEELVLVRRKERFDVIDNLPPEMRGLINDYGYTIVRAYVDLGVVKEKHIRHLVETVLNEFSPTRGSYSVQGIRTEVI